MTIRAGMVASACLVLAWANDALGQTSTSTVGSEAENPLDPLPEVEELPDMGPNDENDPPLVEDGDPREEAGGEADGEADGRGVNLENIVVTAVGVPRRTQLDNSVSVSDLSLDEIKDFAPRTTAEIFRNIPGLRSESSGGENNANIQVRGLPLTTGGAKFVQLQEDGLPIFGFGDITFGNADNFLRFDTTVQRLEVIRGGSASTFASNAPGAVINLMSRTGDITGGEIGITRGLDFDTTRVDFQYGSPFYDDWQFHVGGFYRTGEGARATGFTAEEGGQVKANLTRNFEAGYARLYFKHLNDRTIPYLPAPVRVENGDVRAVEGFDFRNEALASNYLLNNVRIDSNGERSTTDITDGVRSIGTAVGLEFEFDLGANFTLSNRGRYASNHGGFVGSFVGGVRDLSTAATDLGGAGLVYHNGPNAGMPVTQATLGNNIVVDNLLFDVRIDDLNHFVNDVRLSNKIETEFGDIDVSIGYYKSVQQVETEWSFNTYLQEVRGDNAALIDVVDDGGSPISVNGVTTFAGFDPYFDLDFDRDAVFGFLSYSFKGLTVDGSLRYEVLNGRGSSNLGAPEGGPGGFTSYNTDDDGDDLVTGDERDLDVNGDGQVVAAETGLGVVDQGNLFAVDYEVDYVSYSLGLNYVVLESLAAFLRYSQGASANGDRLLLAEEPRFNLAGDLIDDGFGVDTVEQVEAGVKLQNRGRVIPGNLSLFLTGFFANSEESNFEVSSGRAFDRTVEAFGVELETSYLFGPFSLAGGLTLTDAEITEDLETPENQGNRPRRQAVAIYQATAAWNDYLFDRNYSLGVNVVGTSDSFAQDNNDFVLPAFAQFNLFVNVELIQQMILSFNVNNAFDEFGITEAEEGTVPANGIVRARPINGRTISLALRYQF